VIEARPHDALHFPVWDRSLPARVIRNISLATWLLPLGRVFAWLRVDGREHLDRIRGPVIFAANHQSHMDTPVILTALPPRWRYRTATAMAKEFFRAHFFRSALCRAAWFTNSLNYTPPRGARLQRFPLPQRAAGARQTPCVLSAISRARLVGADLPEGRRSTRARSTASMPGVGMIASRLGVPVVPAYCRAQSPASHVAWRGPNVRVRVAFGAPLHLTETTTKRPAGRRRVRDLINPSGERWSI
jgi:1-acyl-sn-glycerol-3-phosphate acyltransferase